MLTTVLTGIGLGGLLRLDLGLLVPILYGLASLSLGSIGWACWRSRRWSPLALAILAAGALLVPFREALDVRLFYVLVGGGQAGLLAAAALAAWTRGEQRPSRC